MNSLIEGVAVNDVKGLAKTKEYSLWRSIIRRCYSENYHNRNPTYAGCTCCESWLYLSNFLSDIERIQNYGKDGWVLDKDLLIRGNKHYSVNTCCFLPEEVNLAMTKSEKARGDNPIGVYFCKTKGKFNSQVSIFGRRKRLGYFDNCTSAFLKYKEEKERYMKELAEKYKVNLSSESFNALMSYTVLITD